MSLSAERSRLKRLGLTVDEYKHLSAGQSDACDICGTHTLRLHVDHDHACCPKERACKNCHRGLLCRTCNLMLGYAKDNRVILANAITYLNKAPRLMFDEVTGMYSPNPDYVPETKETGGSDG